MIVSLIAAIAQNGVIGRDNDLPWKIREDMRFFVKTTRGHAVITGRRNYDAMGRALSQRTNIVVSRASDLVLPDAETVTSIEQALRLAESRGEQEAFVIGGAAIYGLAFPYAERFYRTRVLADVRGDVVFPAVDLSDFSVEELMRGERSADNEYPFVIELLIRRGAPLSWSS